MNRGVRDRVSVIIPCFNAEKYLDMAVESVLSQDYPDIELLLLDDGSRDKTPDIIRQMARADTRIRPFFSGRNSGPFALRNRGLQESSGEFIAFLDSDDNWAAGKLKLSVAALRASPGAGLCHHLLMRVDPDNAPLRMLELNSGRYRGSCFHAMVRQNGVATTSVVIPRQVFQVTGGFDQSLRYRGDWEMWTRISRNYPFVFIDRPLGNYRVHRENVSGDPDRIKPYAFLVLDKFEACFGLDEKEISTYVAPARTAMHLEFGLMELTRRRYGPARKHLWQVLSSHPFNVAAIKAMAKTCIYPLIGR